jgi:hypothetical protein
MESWGIGVAVPVKVQIRAGHTWVQMRLGFNIVYAVVGTSTSEPWKSGRIPHCATEHGTCIGADKREQEVWRLLPEVGRMPRGTSI